MHAYDIGLSTDESSSVCVGGSACVGNSATLSCSITTNSVINVVWRKDGIVITDSTPGYTLIQTQSSSTLVTGVVVHNTTLDDDGAAYTCSAATDTMQFYSLIVLNVVGGMYA